MDRFDSRKLVIALAVAALAACQGKLNGAPPGTGSDSGSSSGTVDADEKSESDVTRFPGLDSSPTKRDSSSTLPDDASPQARDTREDTAAPLPCDDGFSFSPDPPVTSQVIRVDYTHPSKGYAYIGLSVSGPGKVQDGGSEVVQDTPPYLWRFERAVDQGGIYTFTFTSDDNPKASCKKRVRYDGKPPDLSDNNNNNGCTCGSGSGCSECPIVGSCFDSPSKYHPDPNKSGWQCLDDAGCSGGNCKIWCPFEPCEKPSGCSNNTEACYVPPGVTDYEEACRRCCESAPRNATWNAQENFCAEPGQ